ncbi:TerB family tellurite resistance protein [Cognaticolwellia beringensis]|uniref:TerB family tellurite resistance protein n=1 Tax=Cognaticolwellia beringensis TaxID=1967665 RepID=A0A222G3L8_9GAMM|nr:TerB family tellurite resistance protein [Cognaticolwellia beringensis]ASP46332.1 TerB family tellurite resistance protein [Cognaticolwellia beringensis]
MLSKISVFFQALSEADNQQANELSLEIACSVLLCEVMLADGQLDDAEKQKLNHIIVSQFQLSKSEVTEIIKHSLVLCENATDFYQFTSKINENYSLEQRIKMLELLWQMAYADGELASIEEHIIRKIADLLHLRHSEYIQTKLNIQSKVSSVK